jgi:Triose-phosphate Transporter family
LLFSSRPLYIFRSPQHNRLWLLVWTLNNIGVTLLNKAAFAKVEFHYPWLLSSIHMFCNYLGSQYIFWSLGRSKEAEKSSLVTKLLGSIQRQTIDDAGKRTILAFSVIFSLNIAIGNVSLKYVSVNFNQVRCVACMLTRQRLAFVVATAG